MNCSKPSGLTLWCSCLVALGALACAGHVDEDGTAEADPSGNTEANGDELRWWRRPTQPRPPVTGGTGGTGVVVPPRGGSGGVGGSGGTSSGATDCSVCTTAKACCDTVSGGPRCTMNGTTCESLDDVRRRAYVVSCKTFLDSVRHVWKAPPSTCQ